MNDFGISLDAMLQEADDLLRSGQKKEARRVLRDALNMDRDNLATWELLWKATYNVKEEMHCLNRIMAIDPKHEAAKRRLSTLKSSTPRSTRRSPSRKKRRESIVLLLLSGTLVMLICVGIAGVALVRGGYLPFILPNLTATALAEANANCQILIDKAIQASDSFCGNTGSNNACYGNTTLKAELVPSSTKRFSERGDVVSVNELERLSASPLSLGSNQWGIAVFKVIANLPRSLPGETVTMVVFGNTTLDNASGNLESFYFSSELGQISCEKVPFDGLMVTAPDGGGIHFTVNGAELTLMGTASFKAQKNDKMEISLYRGSARIVSDGEEQYFGAGEKVSVDLGGENGTEATSPPSEPEPLSQGELDIACTMTGQYCTQGEISPVSEEEAQSEIDSAITATPTLTLTPSITPIPSATFAPTSTLLVLPTSTLSPTATPIVTNTKPAPTKTKAPTRTPTKTALPTRTSTNTPVPSPTPLAPTEPICTTVSISGLAHPNPNEWEMTITNNNGSQITINRFFAYWVKSPQSQKLDRLSLNGNLIWNTSDSFSPSDIPSEGNWINSASRSIPDATGQTFLIQFQNDMLSVGYEAHIVFDVGCQLIVKQ